MRKHIHFIAVCCFSILSASAQCLSGDCDNGEGIWKDASGVMYKGEFKNGTITGKGLMTYPEDVLDGPFSTDVAKDIMLYKSGLTYEGDIVLGAPSGKGVLTYRDGSSIECNWEDGDPVGEGVLIQPDSKPGSNDGYTIKGPFNDWSISGEGEILYNTGDIYKGGLLNFNEEGEGTLFFFGGGKMEGRWSQGECINCQSAVKSNINMIPLRKANGVYLIDVIINGVPVDNMIFDTGAGEISISPSFLLASINNGDLTDEDILEGKNYINASGDVNFAARVNLREVKVGNKIIENVEASICETCEGLSINLFGLNAISRLGENIKIDFENGELRYW